MFPKCFLKIILIVFTFGFISSSTNFDDEAVFFFTFSCSPVSFSFSFSAFSFAFCSAFSLLFSSLNKHKSFFSNQNYVGKLIFKSVTVQIKHSVNVCVYVRTHTHTFWFLSEVGECVIGRILCQHI